VNTADLVIGIDSSTSACKAIAWDRQGRLVAQARSGLPVSTPHPAWHEQPAHSWWQAAAQSVHAVVQQVGSERLAGLCIAHQRETFVPVDDCGDALRPAILWMDERAAPMVDDLQQTCGKGLFHQVTGKPLTGNLTFSKIAWLREHEPEVFARTNKYLDVQAYLVHCLTGEYRTGWGSADPTGLFDMRRNAWAGELLEKIGIDAGQLPELYPTGSLIGEVSPEAAALTGLPVGLPVTTGLGDGQAGGLGANITRPGEAYLSLGTSVISGTYSGDYLTSLAFRSTSGGIPGSCLLETVILGGAYTIAWLVEKFSGQVDLKSVEGGAAEQVFEQLAGQTPPGADNLLLVPYWNSAMNPYWDSSASGIMVGWRGVHGPGHFYRAILEGIAFEQRLCTSGVEDALGTPLERFIVMGGGARSDLWCQIIADITGKPVYRTLNLEAAALGAGMLAAAAAGFYAGIPQAAQAMADIQPTPFLPDERRQAFYQRLYDEVYVHLFPALQPYLHNLASLDPKNPSERNA
jgi:sugar (pentulose or hexulose) kinase